jgi:hypothetical protein
MEEAAAKRADASAAGEFSTETPGRTTEPEGRGDAEMDAEGSAAGASRAEGREGSEAGSDAAVRAEGAVSPGALAKDGAVNAEGAPRVETPPSGADRTGRAAKGAEGEAGTRIAR